MAENMHKIDFTVPLSGSQLFDLNARVLAMNLCNKFPGLTFTQDRTSIHITGELNDVWFDEWNKHLLFQQ